MSSRSDAPAKAASTAVEVRTLGKYELQRQLGAGGMGTVYLAKDVQLKRLVALKILPHDKAKNPTLVRRFQSEAQAAAQLRHENIVALYENGEVDGHLFIAMEYVDGTDLHELIRKRGKIPIKRSLEIIKQVAQALEHAAKHNIVHRDIKPSNLLIRNDGVVKLTDLGLARSVDDTLETDITRAGTTVGTVDYMAPEQARNSKLADIRSDLYSLGCTWYHMLTGKTPFPDGSMTNKLQAHAVKPPPNPHDLNDQVTEAMVAVVHRLMAKKPEDRYQTPAELLKDLARPSLTRGGAAEEMLSAITEEDDPAVTESQKMKRSGKPGALPPKKAAKQNDEESEGLDWETLRPLVFAGVILIAVIGLGVLIAGFSNGFNFGGGKVVLPDKNLRPQDDGQQVIASPNAKGGAAPNQTTPSVTPGNVITSTQNPANPGDPNQPAPPNMDPASGNKSVTSPTSSNPARTSGTSGSPNPLATGGRTFDADAVPAWSSAPTVRDPGSAAPNTGAKTPTTPSQPVDKTSPKISSQFASFTVGPGTPSKTHFRGLTAVLKAVPRDGATITLQGTGPFLVPEISLRQIQRLVLKGADGSRPILLVRPAEGEQTAGLFMAEGILELDGLDFVLDRAAFSGSDPVRMVASIDGQLMVRNSSFSVWGAGTVPVSAIEFGSQLEPKGLAPILEPRMLVERVFVRGDDVTGIAVARPNADVVIRDSLIVVGGPPALSISGTLPEALASAVGQRPRRAIRILGSTFVARTEAIRVAAEETKIPPTTAIALQDFVSATNNSVAQFLDASAWPIAGPDAEGGKLVHLSFNLKQSLVLGYGVLANLGPNSAFQAREPADWLTLWKREADVQQFSKTTWPANLVADLSTASAKTFAADSLPAGTAIGADVKLLPELGVASRRWLTALSSRPVQPGPLFADQPAKTVTFDVAKQSDFGTFLQQGKWPAGTVIEVTGSGLRPMSPVRLVGKWWKIVGPAQTESQLTFSPKSIASDLTALIDIEGGAIELENLRFQLPAAKKTTITSLISGRGGKLSLDSVTLQGVWSDDTLDAALSWSSTGDALSRLSCRDCFIVNGGSAVRIEMGFGDVFFENSLLVSREHALQLRAGAPPGGSLVALHTTFSAAQGAIHVQGPADTTGVHRCYIDRCVFAPPLPTKADEGAATVLRLADPSKDLARIEWWGTENGFAPEIRSFIRGDAEPTAELAGAALQKWQSTWTAEQDTRLLTGAGGVVLKPEAGSKAGAVKPTQFALDPKSKAQTWSDDGTAIGADIRLIDTAKPAAKPKDAGKTPAPKRSSLPNTF